ncbi:Pr6Pr family membrane protein [Mycetocola zhadangensis]|uniref:F420-dependent oxidoreductase n=1 Tax=Mycetocola zhadangensis TaxID=1164595 RepID=A0A3L7IWD3_9MICO|nr:Pr6Pr family membrane protein [Mycetocola zhadangensis]RLQ82503.1 hypothetical protein D9V28_11045 [Mycetocola zhadangensis]GGF00700.1 hypothetical protein GCM10011313_24670 [Mycetocola zhadangensis]
MDAEIPNGRPARSVPGSARTRGAELAIAGIRLVLVLTTLAAVIVTFADTASRGPVNPFNFFGYFTIQSNLLGVAVLGVTAAWGALGRPQGLVLQLARASITTYLIVVALVYNTLLTGLSGGVDVAWANTVMHVVFPLYCLLDWLLVPDREALPFRFLWVVELYPIVWCGVILLRGATDGWVPYPFFDPSNGYGSVLLYVVGIAVTFILIGAAVFAASRLQLFGSRARLGAQVGDVAS